MARATGQLRPDRESAWVLPAPRYSPRVAAIMAAELGWPNGEAERRVGAFLTAAHAEFDVPGGA